MVKAVSALLGAVLLGSSMVSGRPLFERENDSKKNLILGFADGMGLNVLPMTRQVVQMQENPDQLKYIGYETSLEDDIIGSFRTGSASSLITDSAAAGTALATGHKTNNGMVGVTPDGTPKATILEAAKKAGYLTGIISTSYIYDASPASYTAHAESRDSAGFIADQQVGLTHPLGRIVDLVMGGGKCAFVPQKESKSCRTDDKNLLEIAQNELGWNYVDSKEGLQAANQLPLLGLFEDEDLITPLDRKASKPTLKQMVDKAIELLSDATKDSDKGFVLFYESEVTDTVQHDNDAIGTYSGALEILDAAMNVKDWHKKLEEQGDDTLFFHIADHETGGLGLAYSHAEAPVEVEYGWNPQVLAKAKHSSAFVADLIADAAKESGAASVEIVKQLIGEHLLLENFSDEEAQKIAEASSSDESDDLLFAVGHAVDIRARIGWTTDGHTATDVPLYCYENEYCLKFRGNRENTAIPELMGHFLGVEQTQWDSKLAGFNTSAPVAPEA